MTDTLDDPGLFPTEASFDAEALRRQVGDWLAEHWTGRSGAGSGDDTANGRRWLETVVDAGWAAPSWPRRWHGRGLSPALSEVVATEFARVGAPGSGQDVTNLWANSLLAFGQEALKEALMRRLLLGDVDMCLLYSEPGAGSDLAAVQTRAERDGDEWVVTGQKVWTSSGRGAEFGMLVARTNWDVPKHAGITFFWLPMRQPGVEVRPLRQATGDSRFNEVFLTEARVADGNRLGEVNSGWRVLQTALAYERAVMGESQRRRGTVAGKAVRSADDEAPAPIPDLSLIDLARSVGQAEDPVVRQQLMALRALVQVNEWNGRRAKAELEQGTSSSVVSLGKLAMSRILHTAGSLEKQLLGAEGMVEGASSPRSADASYALLNAFFTSIGGGTDQIQRNIIGERILGLPKEPELDRDVAFRDVPKA